MNNWHLLISFLLTCSILFSCTEDEPSDNDSSSEGLVAASITVYDANSWTSSSNPLETVDGAIINLYNDQSSLDSGTPDYTVTTSNGTGTVMIPEPEDVDGDGLFETNDPNFLITIEGNGKNNFANGYGIAGVFFCQIDLDSFNEDSQNAYESDYQSGAVVGGIKYTDLNGDGIINSEDLTSTAFINLQLDSDDDSPTPIDSGGASCTNKPEERNVVYIGQ